MKTKAPAPTTKITSPLCVIKASTLLVGLLFNAITAEYLFVTQTDCGYKPVQQCDHPTAYRIYTTYTFPMNTAHPNPQITNDIARNEQLFLQTKLPTPIVAVYIPNTLYELLVLHAYTHDIHLKQKICQVKKIEYDRILDGIASYTHPLTTKNQLRDLHYCINTYAVQQLSAPQTSSGYTQAQTHAEANRLVNALYATYQSKTTTALERLFGYTDKQQLHTLLHTCITYEHEAHAANCHVIYRGTNEWYTDRHIKNSPQTTTPHSCSYGLSLFSGFQFDSGACAFLCMATSQYKKAICINKAAYLSRKNDYAFFYIPPFNLLEGFFSVGEMFHARSKIHPEHLPLRSQEQRVNNEVNGLCECAITYATLYNSLVTEHDLFPSASAYESALTAFLRTHEYHYNPLSTMSNTLTEQRQDHLD